MSCCSQPSTHQRKILCPEEIDQRHFMMEEVVEASKQTFVNPFSDDLGKNQLYNIPSDKTVSTEINDSLVTINERGKK